MSGTAGAPVACNQVVLDAPDYVLSMDPGMPPAAKGGTLVYGSYFLTRSIWYGQTGTDTPMGRAKVEVRDTWKSAEDLDTLEEDDSLEPTRYFTSTVTISGTTLTTTQSCPTVTPAQSFEYTAEGTTLTLYVIDQGEHFAQVFERQD